MRYNSGGIGIHTSDVRRSCSVFCLSALALRSSASFARLASISALLFSDIMSTYSGYQFVK